MQNFIRSIIMILLVFSVVAFTGCEEGLDLQDSNNGDFSFSDMYSKMKSMQEEIDLLKRTTVEQANLINSLTNNQSASSGSLQSMIDNNAASITSLQNTTGSQGTAITNLQTTIGNQATAITDLQDTTSSQATAIETLQIESNSHAASIGSLEESVKVIDVVSEMSSPVGTIIAWQKNMNSTPDLPGTWVECNGQTITDADSVYFGMNTQNLNGEGRFLRGGSTSGIYQEDTTAINGLDIIAGGAHQHRYYDRHSDHDNSTPAHINLNGANLSGLNNYSTERLTYDEDNYNGFHDHDISGDYETRPVNMTVVWIMRIK
ncbi:MAG: hypothetical protein GY754_20555 [bacterium]|nr:hypothetical protein [bacterium]